MTLCRVVVDLARSQFADCEADLSFLLLIPIFTIFPTLASNIMTLSGYTIIASPFFAELKKDDLCFNRLGSITVAIVG